MKIILKNVRVVNPEQKLDVDKTNLVLENGVITSIGEVKEKDLNNSKVFEMEGKVVTPGFFDMHVHLREPGREDEETVITGCNAAANGGFTGIACMPNTEPAIDSAEVVNFIKKQAANHLVDVFPIGAATMERKGEILSPMLELSAAGAIAFSDDGVAIKTSAIVKRALEYSKMLNQPIIEHCEDESLAGGAMNEGTNSTLFGLPPLPSVSEDIIVARDILLAEYTGGKIHIAHISTKKSVELVRDAKQKGINVTAEVTPHHFTLTDDELKTYDTNFKMNPPLRTKTDVKAVIEGLKDNTIDCIASDHAPHSIEEKEMEFELAPNGILGLETQIGLTLTELMHKNILTLGEIIYKMAIMPRRILNLSIPKIEIGEAANLTILDLEEIWNVDRNKFKSKSRNTPFDKMLLKGKPVAAINKAKMFFEDKNFDI
jgi:dihydroorotase